MTAFLDTSVLVAAFWADHPHHAESLALLAGAAKSDVCCGAHSMAEVYAVMTRLPTRPVVPPEHAMLFVREIRERLTIVAIDEAAYYATLASAAQKGIAGARIYDALLLHCARTSGAERIYTLNLSDFRRIAPDLADRMRAP
jgi:predicted nucleic acid-binding protein